MVPVRPWLVAGFWLCLGGLRQVFYIPDSSAQPGELCWLCVWLGGKELVVLFMGAPFQRAKEQTGYLSAKAIISQESCCREQQEPTWLIEKISLIFFVSLSACKSLFRPSFSLILPLK